MRVDVSKQPVYLAVGVWVGATHGIPLVLKDLDPAVVSAQLSQLLHPLLDHLDDGALFHQGQCQVRVRMEAHHSAATPKMVNSGVVIWLVGSHGNTPAGCAAKLGLHSPSASGLSRL